MSTLLLEVALVLAICLVASNRSTLPIVLLVDAELYMFTYI
jgi:hypothetical protein